MVNAAFSAPIIQSRNSDTFWSSGHRGVLLSAFLFTEVAFMVWVLLGVLSVYIAADLGLSASDTSLMVSIPILTGTLMRLPVGVLVDRLGPKRVGLGVLTILIPALMAVWMGPVDKHIYMDGLILGVAGVSFSIAIPLVSHRYPPRYQGVALGITAVGGVGTVVAAIIAPYLAEAYGWRTVFGLAILPVILTMMLFWGLNRNETDTKPLPSAWRHYFQVLRYADSRWFALFYAVTFGGFISLTASLVTFFHSQYQLTPTTAGGMTAACIVGGTLFRPLGGFLADRFGGIRTLQLTFVVVVLAMPLLAMGMNIPSLAFFAVFAAMSALGTGNGAIFQLIPLRFPRRMGAMTGLVGTAGGLGGFLLVWGYGLFRDWTGGYQTGFMVLAGLSLLALLGLLSIKRRWRTTWGMPSRTQARV